MADLLQRLNIGQQDPRDSGMQPGTQGQPPQINGLGLGDLASGTRGTPPVAMSESDTQRLERQQAGPQDLAALSGSSADRLLFDRTGFGGGANGFSGSADPYGARNVPLPPTRPGDDALMVQPATTGTVSGMNPGATGGPQRQLVASSSYHPDLASNAPPGGRPGAAADFRGQAGDAALINIKKQQAQHEIDLAALARDRNNWDRWDDVTAAYDKAHPIISPLTKRALGADEVNFPDPNAQGGSNAAPPAGAPPGTRLAPDGNYYAPDPSRPGKYLKLQVR